MRNTKRRIRALGLFALVMGMGLLAEGALGAYLVNLGPFLLATFTGAQIGTSKFWVPGRNLKIECEALHLSEGKIESSGDARATATYLGCLTFALASGTPLPCEFTGLKTFSAKLLFLPILHGGATYVVIEPQVAGGNFTTVEFKAGTECSLPLTNPVSGTISASVDALDAVTQLILLSASVQLLTGNVLRFGGFPSYIERHLSINLTGAHEGQKLGIH